MEFDDLFYTGNIREKYWPGYLKHTWRFAFFVRDLGEPYTYTRNFTTLCEYTPSSWSFKMEFKQQPVTKIVSCKLTVRRTDFEETLSADVEMCYSFIKRQEVQFEQLYRREYSSGQVLQEYTEDILPFPWERRNFIDSGITVEVTLKLKCCSDEDEEDFLSL